MLHSLQTLLRGRQSSSPSRPPRFQPRLEAFEDRLVPSTFTVTDSSDAGQAYGGNNPMDTNGLVSLRSAIGAADADSAKGHSDAIKFSSSLAGQVLDLTLGAIELTKGKASVTIDGGSNNVTVSGGNSSGIFECDSGSNYTIKNVTFEYGYSEFGGALTNFGNMTVCNCYFYYNYADYGGAIYNAGKLTVKNSDFYYNYSEYDGGAIFNSGSLNVQESYFYGNYAYGNGGAIASEGDGSKASASVCNSYFYDNYAYYYGGAIYTYYSSLSLKNDSFSGNSAGVAGGNTFNG